MNRFLSALLVIVTLWMSTWMVTDIHVVIAADKPLPHPVFSAQADLTPSTDSGILQQTEDDHTCHFCSYDHGGHIGALALPEHFLPIAMERGTTLLPPYSFILSATPPSHLLRPPIV